MKLLGVVTSLMTADSAGQAGAEAVVAASGSLAQRLEELQFDRGEGPSRDAFGSTRPVLVPELEHATGRWPGYAPTACEEGARAVFAFPLHVGAARFGVLSLYGARSGMLGERRIVDCLLLAELATEMLLDDPAGTADAPHADRNAMVAGSDFRDAVYQAQGMLMITLGVGLGEALARLRAHAYANGQDLSDLATDIVAGRTQLPAIEDGQ